MSEERCPHISIHIAKTYRERMTAPPHFSTKSVDLCSNIDEALH